MIDAHFHCWQLARNDYGWLTPALAPIYRDVRVADWAAHAQTHGILGGVLVQAAPTQAETHFLLDQARQHPMVLGVVGWVDMLAPDAVQQVQTWAATEPWLKGLRPMLQDLPDTEWILQAQVQPVLHAMARCGLVLDALVQPRHLPVLARLLAQHPTLRVVIDHGAKPQIDVPLAESRHMAAWAEGLHALAQCSDPGRVMCKLSGLWTEAAHHLGTGVACEVVQPWCEALLRIWGPERLLWGSDWPVLELAGSYATWREVSCRVIATCSDAQQALILGGNARRIYTL